jgi:hypothetical protein
MKKDTKKVKTAKQMGLSSKWSVKAPLYIDKTDKRFDEHTKQLAEVGFSDTETWSLRNVIAEFVIPRLKRFKAITNGYPAVDGMNEKEWNITLDKMIFAFEWTNKFEDEEVSKEKMAKDYAKYQEGMALFSKWFLDLWW